MKFHSEQTENVTWGKCSMVLKKRRGNMPAGAHLMVGFEGIVLEEGLRTTIKEFEIGGIVLFKRNIKDPDQLQFLLEEVQNYAEQTLGRRLLVAIDQEGGSVQRLSPPFTQLPAARDLAIEGHRAIIEWTTKAALELRRMGIQVNLAPVLDVPSEGTSHFMESRALGSDPNKVGELGQLWIRILQENGVSATAKHYPGLGQAESDPHHFAPVIRWQSEDEMQRDLLPFRDAVREGVHCFMTSHALYPFLDPQWPATLSSKINREWLRDHLGFEGVLLSDDMDMAAVAERYTWDEMVRQGLLSTIDFFLLCQRPENIEPFYRSLHNAIENDPDLENLHSRSVRRIEALLARHDLY
jgi:beta-N-acetylhexosaminidase